MKSLRSQKKLIAITYHSIILVIAMIGVNTENPLLAAVGIFDFLTFRLFPVVRLFQTKLITSTDCLGCQKQIDLIDCWQCGCGYASQVSRHVFLPCQQCGKVFSFITCPHCDTKILV